MEFPSCSKARLDHALDLYAKELAPYIVTTGSKQRGTDMEAYTGLTYLLERGIPESKIIVIVDGSNTYQSLSATSTAIQGVGLGSEVLLVRPLPCIASEGNSTK